MEIEKVESTLLSGKGKVSVRTPSYHNTRWEIINTILEKVDAATDGKAGIIQRFSSFLVIGGFAALINLIVFTILFNKMPQSWFAFFPSKYWGDTPRQVVAEAVAAEISIIANFIPNDYFTFRFLPGHARSWWLRCARFHVTAFSGSLVTALLEFIWHSLFHVPAFWAQVIALFLAVFYNFTAHHLFTYRAQHHHEMA